MSRDGDLPMTGDLGFRRVHRGADAEYEGNVEFALVLPAVDKVAIMALAAVELTALFLGPPGWTDAMHFATIAAIAGLGGYSMTRGAPPES